MPLRTDNFTSKAVCGTEDRYCITIRNGSIIVYLSQSVTFVVCWYMFHWIRAKQIKLLSIDYYISGDAFLLVKSDQWNSNRRRYKPRISRNISGWLKHGFNGTKMKYNILSDGFSFITRIDLSLYGNSWIIKSISWLVMFSLIVTPGHHQPWIMCDDNIIVHNKSGFRQPTTVQYRRMSNSRGLVAKPQACNVEGVLFPVVAYHTTRAWKWVRDWLTYHLCARRPLVKWLGISSEGFHQK